MSFDEMTADKLGESDAETMLIAGASLVAKLSLNRMNLVGLAIYLIRLQPHYA